MDNSRFNEYDLISNPISPNAAPLNVQSYWSKEGFPLNSTSKAYQTDSRFGWLNLFQGELKDNKEDSTQTQTLSKIGFKILECAAGLCTKSPSPWRRVLLRWLPHRFGNISSLRQQGKYMKERRYLKPLNVEYGISGFESFYSHLDSGSNFTLHYFQALR